MKDQIRLHNEKEESIGLKYSGHSSYNEEYEESEVTDNIDRGSYSSGQLHPERHQVDISARMQQE